MTSRSHASADAYDPFTDTRGPVGHATHFDVERIPGSVAGEPARFRKTIKHGVGADLLPMIHRENLLLMDMATRGLRHVAQSLEFTRDSSDAPFVVTTLDAGPSLNLWRRYDFIAEGGTAGAARPFLTPAVLARLLHHLLLALREFHGAGFIHCDIHAGNVCLPFERRGDAVRPVFEQLRLIDFGHTLSARLNFDEPLRLDPAAGESLRRVSPAFRAALRHDADSGHANAVQHLDFRLDLYALGALAMQFLGWVDWSGEPRAAALHAALSASVDALLAQDCDGTVPEPGLHDRLLQPVDAMLTRLAPPDPAWQLPRKRAAPAVPELARETPLIGASVTPMAPPVAVVAAPVTAPAPAATAPAATAAAGAGPRAMGRRSALTVAALAVIALAGWAWQAGHLPGMASVPARPASAPAASSTARPTAPKAAAPTPRAAASVPDPSAPPLTAREVEEQLNAMVKGAASGRWGQVETAARRIASSAGWAGSAQSSAPLLASGHEAIARADYDDAAALLRRATAQSPSDGKAWSALGYAELRRNDLHAANLALSRSLQLRPQDGSTWAHLGEILAVQGNAAASAAALELAVYFSTQRARTLAHLRAAAPSSLIAPEFQAVIQDMGSALDDLPARQP